jgi:hypothetical protein
MSRAASYDNRICSQHVIAQKIHFISQKSTFRQRNVNDLSYYDPAVQHENWTFVFVS